MYRSSHSLGLTSCVTSTTSCISITILAKLLTIYTQLKNDSVHSSQASSSGIEGYFTNLIPQWLAFCRCCLNRESRSLATGSSVSTQTTASLGFIAKIKRSVELKSSVLSTLACVSYLCSSSLEHKIRSLEPQQGQC
jgi:hypothetical protein